MDTAQWPQEIVVKPLEEIVTNTRCQKQQQQQGQGLDGRKVGRPQKEQALNCPRCNSTNTKFCYYNNYSLTQPRYYCKTCRRYWTEGGSLRNIPVGGGSRKNKRSSTTNTTTASSTSSGVVITANKNMNKLPDLVAPPTLPTSTKMIHEAQDLNLGYAQDFRVISDLVQVPNNNMDPPSNKTHISYSALELLTGITNINPRGLGFTSFMPTSGQDPNSMSVYTNGFSLQEFKPSLSFSLDGIGGGGYGSLHQESGGGGRLLFPFEDLKQAPSTANNNNNGSDHDHEHEHHHHQQQQQQNVDRDQQGDVSTGVGGGGYWTGMLGGGSW